MSALTPEEMLRDMALHARSSIVNVEPKTVALWNELIGSVLCAAAFDVGLALNETDEAVRLDEREACARIADQFDDGGCFGAGQKIRERGGR